MGDDGVLGYVEYDPDGDETDTIDRTLCADCATGCDPADGKRWATVRDSPVYGADVPYPECHKCGDVMRPTITFGGIG